MDNSLKMEERVVPNQAEAKEPAPAVASPPAIAAAAKEVVPEPVPPAIVPLSVTGAFVRRW